MMDRLFAVAGLAAVAVALALSPAFAAGETIVIPYGDWIADAGDMALSILVPVMMALAGRWLAGISPDLAAALVQSRADRLLERAIGFGISATAGAQRGRSLSVETGSAVLAEAARYAVDQAPTLVRRLGGADAIRRMILARLDLDAAASAERLGLRP